MWALYALAAVAFTWPWALRLRVMDPGDAAFFAWVMAWEAHALAHDPASLPHPNVYHPARYVLGLDEPIFGTTLLALPLFLWTSDAVLVFGLVRLLTYVLSAWGTYLVARELGCRPAVALWAGALFAFSPIRVDQAAHLSTLGTQWLPLVLYGLLRFARSARWRHALGAAVAYVLSFYACGYHGVLGLLVWPLPVALLLGSCARRWRRAALAAVLAGLALLPLYALHRAAFAEHPLARSGQETTTYSARLESFAAASAWNRIYGPLSARFRGSANNLFPGLVPPLLVAAAAWLSWRRGLRPGRTTLALALLAAGGALVACGPELRLGEWSVPSPVAWARSAVPFLGQVRAYARAGIFLALGLALLAAWALERLRLARPWALAVAAAALAETLVVPIPLASWARVIDTSQPAPPVYAWLAAQPGNFALVELPLLPGTDLFRRPAWHESIYMVRSTLHWKRLVNGYVGVEPSSYARLREELRRFPGAQALEALRQAGVRYAVVHAAGFGPNQWERLQRELPARAAELRPVARFGDDYVFELRAR